ncbi:MAG TPA: lytic transglycosylase F, partial [Usitatibacter sp.]|nr:lytic transglycosylase F [Usitatibacter sp.]
MRAPAWLAILAALGLALPALAQHAPAQPVQPAPPAKVRQLDITNKPWTGDFDAMLERRMIRVYAPFSRTLYFSDRGRERGITAELVRDWERYLNRKYAKRFRKRPLTIYLIPATRDKLLPYLEQGLADVAAGNLTITADRLEEADFVPGNLGGRVVDEVVVTGPKSPQVESLDDLGGKTVHVRKSSSYYESLELLNERLGREGKPPVKLAVVPDSLEDEDLMEMLDAGLLELLVVDDWKAGLWARVLPKIKVRTDLVLRDNGRAGWAVRKGSAKLEAEIAEFFADWVAKNGIFEGRLGTYTKRAKELRDPTASRDYRRFQQLIAIFEKYGERYQFDPLMLAAQGYQ